MELSYLSSMPYESKRLIEKSEMSFNDGKNTLRLPTSHGRSRRGGKLVIDHRKQLEVNIKKIKKQIVVQRKKTQQIIKENTEIVTKNENDMNYLSKKHHQKWMKIKSMNTFLSAMRALLKQFRNFGLVGHRSKTRVDQGMSKTRKACLLYTDSCTMDIHCMILLAIVVYMITTLPVDIAFGLSVASNSIQLQMTSYAIHFYFLFDICVNCFVATFSDSTQTWIEDRKMILSHYAKNYLWFDLLAVVPFSGIFNNSDNVSSKLLMLPSILQLLNALFQRSPTKLRSRSLVQDKIKRVVTSGSKLHIINSVFLTFVFIHVASCFWCFFCRLEDRNWLRR